MLQAYLPDALPALEQLTAWARARVAAGGARIKVRLVKGANLAMERVDAVMHDWSLATYDSKLDSDANYVRCLDFALRRENTAAVRIGVAGHNLFDIAYAWLLAQSRGLSVSNGGSDLEFEMLLGMAQGQVEAVDPRRRTRAAVRPGGPPRRVRRGDQLPRAPPGGERLQRQLPLRGVRARRRPGDVRPRARPVPRVDRTREGCRAAHRPEPRPGSRPAARRARTPIGCAFPPRRRGGRRGCRTDAGGARHRPLRGERRRHRTARAFRGRDGLRRRGLRRDGRLRLSRSGRSRGGCARLPKRRRHRPVPAGQPRVEPRHPGPHRDLDSRRQHARRRPHHRRRRARADRRARAGCRAGVGSAACERTRDRDAGCRAFARGAPRRADRGGGIRDRQGLRRGGRRGQRGGRLRELLRGDGARARPGERCRLRPLAPHGRHAAVELPDRDPRGRSAGCTRRRLGRRLQTGAAGPSLRGGRRRGAVGGRCAP